jgi:peptidoglycan LD-endopeptidase LytH
MVPSPTSNAVVNWLKGHTAGIGRIVEPDLKLENVPVFDLSVGSPELGNSLEPGDMAFTTQRLLSRMQAAHSPVGIGRYIETRIIHTNIERHKESNDGPAWATIHLGLDLFMAAGSPVYTPVAGIVHSFSHDDETPGTGPTLVLQHTVADGRSSSIPSTEI